MLIETRNDIVLENDRSHEKLDGHAGDQVIMQGQPFSKMIKEKEEHVNGKMVVLQNIDENGGGDFLTGKNDNISFALGTKEKLLMTSKLAIPTILASVVQKFQEIINLQMIGYQTHLQPEELRAMMAGCGLGNTT